MIYRQEIYIEHYTQGDNMQPLTTDPLLSFFKKLTMDDALGIGGAEVSRVENFAFHPNTGTLLIDWMPGTRNHNEWFNDKNFRSYHAEQLRRMPEIDWEGYDLIGRVLWGRYGIIRFDENDLRNHYGLDFEEAGLHDVVNGVPFVCIWADDATKNGLDALATTLLKQGLPRNAVCYAAYDADEFAFDPFYLGESHKTIKKKDLGSYADRWRRTIGDSVDPNDKNKLIARVRKVSNILSDIFSEAKNISENKAKSNELFYDLSFIRWLRSHGLAMQTGKVPYYREGGTARAYFIGDKVVKITNNRVEANVAHLAKKYGNPNTVAIDVKKFDDYYAILMPKVEMDNLDMSYKKAADLLTVYIDSDEFKEFPTDEAEQRDICQRIADEYGEDPTMVSYMVDVMKILRKLYDDTGFVHTDVTPTNVGSYQGRVVIPDLGPNQPGGFSPEKELEKLQASRKKLSLPDEPLI